MHYTNHINRHSSKFQDSNNTNHALSDIDWHGIVETVIDQFSYSWKVKTSLWIGLLAILFACILPPWKEPVSGQSAGYSWLWNSPYQNDLKSKRAQGLRLKESAVTDAGAKVRQAQKKLSTLRNSPQELERGRLGGFALEGALLAEYNAKAELNEAQAVLQAVESKPSSMWVDAATVVEIDLTALMIEVSVISLLTVGATFTAICTRD